MKRIQLILLLTLLSSSLMAQEQSSIEKKNAVTVNNMGLINNFPACEFLNLYTSVNYSRILYTYKIGYIQSSIGIRVSDGFLFVKDIGFGENPFLEFSVIHYFGKEKNLLFTGGKLDCELIWPEYAFSILAGYFHEFQEDLFWKISIAPKLFEIRKKFISNSYSERLFSLKLGREYFIAFELGFKF